MSRALIKIVQHHWFDILVTGAAWYGGFKYHHFDDSGGSMLVLPMIFLPLWIFFRLSPLMYTLAERGRRESIAITPMPAGQYLFPLVKIPALMAAAPLTGTIAILITAQLQGNSDLAFFAAFTFFFGIIPVIVAYIGIIDLLVRICHDYSLKALYDLIWSYFITWGVAISAGALTMAMIEQFGISGMILLPLFIFVGAYVLKGHWKDSCAAYYVFE